jgi:caffeoyl-CoA O-methyltransferase
MADMVDEPSVYFRRFLPSRADVFHRLEEEARNEGIPIVGPVVGKLLYMLARLSNARQIVEMGTAGGYSTLFMANACRHTGGRIITYETKDALARRARDTIAGEGLSNVVEVRCEDAVEAIGSLKGPVDMIFIDIEKKDYVRALPSCARLLRQAGLLVADNTGFADAHTFNQAVHESPQWEGINLWSYLPDHSPEHDGLCLALKV